MEEKLISETSSSNLDSQMLISRYSSENKHLNIVGVLEPIPAITGREAGYNLDMSPAYNRADM